MREALMDEQEELRRSELKYWQKMHPKAKVEIKKKEIVITYPLPEDFDIIRKITEKYKPPK